MRYSFELLKADITDELAKINKIEAAFADIQDKLTLNADSVPPYDRGAIGYILHNFYCGCENIFKSIARFFENDLEPQTWHRDLLKRMKIGVNGYRPRVIDEELFLLLDEFRAFRHKFRYSYSFELDWEKERLIAKKLNPTIRLLNRQVHQFLNQLKNADAEL